MTSLNTYSLTSIRSPFEVDIHVRTHVGSSLNEYLNEAFLNGYHVFFLNTTFSVVNREENNDG